MPDTEPLSPAEQFHDAIADIVVTATTAGLPTQSVIAALTVLIGQLIDGAPRSMQARLAEQVYEGVLTTLQASAQGIDTVLVVIDGQPATTH